MVRQIEPRWFLLTGEFYFNGTLLEAHRCLFSFLVWNCPNLIILLFISDDKFFWQEITLRVVSFRFPSLHQWRYLSYGTVWGTLESSNTQGNNIACKYHWCVLVRLGLYLPIYLLKTLRALSKPKEGLILICPYYQNSFLFISKKKKQNWFKCSLQLVVCYEWIYPMP